MNCLLSITLLILGCSFVTSQRLRGGMFNRFQDIFKDTAGNRLSQIRRQRQVMTNLRPGNRLGTLVPGGRGGRGNGQGGQGNGQGGRGGGRGRPGNGGVAQPPPPITVGPGPDDGAIIKKDDEIRRGPKKDARVVVEGSAAGVNRAANARFGFFGRFGSRFNRFRDRFQQVRLIRAGEGLGIPKKFVLNLKPNVDDAKVQGLLRQFSKNKGRNLGLGKLKSRQQRSGLSNRGDSILLEDVSESDLMKLLQLTDLVEEVEQEVIVEALACNKLDAGTRHEYYKWGLDRIDNSDKVAADDNLLNIDGDGDGVDVYVVDTGVRADHTEFQLLGGSRRVDSEFFSIYGSYAGAAEDDNGHGTHVAGIVAGRTWGVARNATVIAVKILDWRGKGGSFDVADGIKWAIDKAIERKRKSIINLSIGSAVSTLLDNVVKEAIENGIVVTVAAGNNGGDACTTSPARVKDAITVGAMDRDDSITWFSNRGACTNVYAPGLSIGSAYYSAQTAAAALSGTSMASPFVAGVLAAHMSTIPAPSVFDAAFVQAMGQVIMTKASSGVIQGAQEGDNNRLLQTGCT